MNNNNSFSLTRFGLLFRYTLIHTYKRVLLSFFTGVGIFFIFIILKSLINKGPSLDSFVLFFVIIGVIYIGNSFPAFRTKEKSQVFIMIPASVTERFFFEFFIRIILPVLVIPLLCWIAYLMEGYFYEAVTNHTFIPVSLIERWDKLADKFGYILIPSIFLLIHVILFMGGSIFMRNPIGKTFFFFAIITLFHFCLVFLTGKYLQFRSMKGGNPLWIKDREDAFIFFGIYFIILTIGLLSVAWFKLKEREV